jgi:cytochrome c-type biogenesis protein CcmH
MTLFIALAIGLVALALLPVLRALRGKRGAAAADQRLAVYRARLTEIDAEARDGVLATDQALAARTEIEREMLAHVDANAVDAAAQSGRWPVTGIVVSAGTVLLAAFVYMYGGRPDLVGADTSTVPAADVAAMIERITAHLEQKPDDRQGWEMLGRAYMALGRYAAAVTAFERLLALAGDDDANALVRYADALAMAAGGRLGGKPTELLARALALEPEHRTALWLSGMAAVERGENALAVAYWQKLLPLLREADTKAEVARLIEQAGGSAGDTAAAAATDAPLRVRVELAPALSGTPHADAMVFVTARAEDGPPIPLAAVRRPASELPFEVVLDDTLAMTPELRLSRHSAVTITARVSETGGAERASGDLIGERKDVPTTGSTPVTVVIDSVVP